MSSTPLQPKHLNATTASAHPPLSLFSMAWRSCYLRLSCCLDCQSSGLVPSSSPSRRPREPVLVAWEAGPESPNLPKIILRMPIGPMFKLDPDTFNHVTRIPVSRSRNTPSFIKPDWAVCRGAPGALGLWGRWGSKARAARRWLRAA